MTPRTAQDAAALAALETQAHRLADISSRLSAAAGERSAYNFGASSTDAWTGPARLAFDAASGRLHRQLAIAADQVEQARDETRRAIATLGGRS